MTFKTREELLKLTKLEIDEYGNSIGLNLDRRKKKVDLIEKVLEFQDTNIVANAIIALAIDEPVEEPEVTEIESAFPVETKSTWSSWFENAFFAAFIIAFVSIIVALFLTY